MVGKQIRNAATAEPAAEHVTIDASSQHEMSFYTECKLVVTRRRFISAGKVLDRFEITWTRKESLS